MPPLAHPFGRNQYAPEADRKSVAPKRLAVKGVLGSGSRLHMFGCLIPVAVGMGEGQRFMEWKAPHDKGIMLWDHEPELEALNLKTQIPNKSKIPRMQCENRIVWVI